MLFLVGGVLVGLFNVLPVGLAQVDAFIVTLVTGQVIFAITTWYTGGQQTTGADRRGPLLSTRWRSERLARSPARSSWLSRSPRSCGSSWSSCQSDATSTRSVWTRRWPASPASRDGPAPRWDDLLGGILAAFAAVLLAARQTGIAQANVGPDSLMPAPADAFLGSTTIKPGRVNALGTVLGVFITTAGISGLRELLPGRYFLEPLVSTSSP